MGYGPDVSGINGSLDFRVAHGESWGGQKRAQPVPWVTVGRAEWALLYQETYSIQ